jgi:hypothetical protein
VLHLVLIEAYRVVKRYTGLTGKDADSSVNRIIHLGLLRETPF